MFIDDMSQVLVAHGPDSLHGVQEIYDSGINRKHKRPGGWGSLCPEDMEPGEAQALLNGSVLVDDARYAIDDDWVFKAFQHQPGRWHGFPIPWSAMPPQAARALIERGLLDESTWRRALRKGLGSEFRA